ncbi:hypothetical protein JYK14_20550 [Siccirubricoccus sp. KC 17139]|uniref:Uncharacterized protein n=1 Tax=Siccirubricoccus soli TaxID=2899147 RepID=A0ABT1D9B8_9PROT|nr:hypothetical protein [Siccirubricoccus soli]MCO6418535.1 hypothetical protein [Siccirubricoccus soli]MCP2684670.1 hypothetical protein [Siccirubricoccus soli]
MTTTKSVMFRCRSTDKKLLLHLGMATAVHWELLPVPLQKLLLEQAALIQEAPSPQLGPPANDLLNSQRATPQDATCIRNFDLARAAPFARAPGDAARSPAGRHATGDRPVRTS